MMNKIVFILISVLQIFAADDLLVILDLKSAACAGVSRSRAFKHLAGA